MKKYVIDLHDIRATNVEDVGGKGANLGELFAIDGVRVPDGFCVTTAAYKEVIGSDSDLSVLLGELSKLKANDRRSIAEISENIRNLIEHFAMPKYIVQAVAAALARFGVVDAYAVRSSATAEDLPTVSFAGQQDSYLNVIGCDAILDHISKCWASLFTERAVTYRIRNGFDHRNVFLSVIIQKMVDAEAAGVMFTADPITSNRKVISIDASFGLGEAVVSGLVSADNYTIAGGDIVGKKISAKKFAIHALNAGGTETVKVDAENRENQVLSNEQIVALGHIGRKIETHFGCPQDIEWCWCWTNGVFYIVQSRPITTLFPIPVTAETGNRVYVSVGHQQMMTDAIKPLGLSIHTMTSGGSMKNAGGRLFVDVTRQLVSPDSRAALMGFLGKSIPLVGSALSAIADRAGFFDSSSIESIQPRAAGSARSAQPAPPFDNDPAIVAELIRCSENAVDQLQHEIQSKSGPQLFDFIEQDIRKLNRLLFDPKNIGAIRAPMDAASWINEKMSDWLGEKNAADTISQSVPNNVTSQMGMALMDVADVVRLYPDVVTYLRNAAESFSHRTLLTLEGGTQTWDAMSAFLERYGMRCVGEIDVTRPRWIENPAAIVPMILSNVRNFEPGASRRKFKQGLQQANNKEHEILERLQRLPDGDRKAVETRQKISLVRNFSGYREYPKYGNVRHYWLYRQALLKEADRLVQANVIVENEDVYYLTFEEFREASRAQTVSAEIIDRRKKDYARFERLSPPAVLTSDGEIVAGRYEKKDLPADAIAGLAVSSGIVEGRARVIRYIEDADLHEGDILVTPFTDPSWTLLFVGIKGLVTEVGGLMTHGAVIAREYGLPAVVGVENATQLIHDGQRIRINGTDGYVELL
jgi:rifampicin phosphotransferase